jgi:hypothetical protein
VPALVDRGHDPPDLWRRRRGAPRRDDRRGRQHRPAGSGSSQTRINAARRQRVNAAVLLTVAAPEFVVIK